MGDYKRASDTNKIYKRTISMERKQNGFKGIFIPTEMLEYNDGTLSLVELFVLEEIEYFCRAGRYKSCLVKNEHFMNVIGVSERTVIRAISHLDSLGAISVTQKRGVRVIQYNYDEFRPKYSDVEYEDYLSDDMTNSQMSGQFVPDGVTICQEGVTISQEGVTNSQKSSFTEENKKENKEEKTPAEPVSSGNHNPRRNFGTNKLSDELESGKEIKEQVTRKKKKSNFDKCLEEIDKPKYGFSTEVKELLREHLNMSFYSKDPKRITGRSNYFSKLDRLAALIKQGYNGVEVVQQSIDKKWNGFYEPNHPSNRSNESFADDVGEISLEEAQAIYDEKLARVARGELEVY